MIITPSQIIGYRNSVGNGSGFNGYNATTGEPLPTIFHEATTADIEDSINLAHQAFPAYRKISAAQKSSFLDEIAVNIEALGDELLTVMHQETGLPLPRLTGERGRTTGQLRYFAQLLRNDKWRNIITDGALPDRQPMPRPALIQMQVPLGPVVIFGASNFPLAFSVAGGDTAAALAAGCPVIFKAHPAHPATCQLVGNAIAEAALKTGMPDGVFSMVHGPSHQTGEKLVSHKRIKAVAFTGSYKGGKALYDLAAKREEPIPVYAEMGSVNPVFFLPEAIAEGGETLVSQFAASITLGAGQFCTNPGVFVLMANENSEQFINQLAEALSSAAIHPMLTKGISDAYGDGVEKQKKLSGATSPLKNLANNNTANLITANAKDALTNPEYFEEVFGPAAVGLLVNTYEEMFELIDNMPGQLTATVYAAEGDNQISGELIEQLTYKAGRVMMNNFPTGVEVCDAMVHGGPFPATTDSRVTSVGSTSIYRFTRPVCYQNIKVGLLLA